MKDAVVKVLNNSLPFAFFFTIYMYVHFYLAYELECSIDYKQSVIIKDFLKLSVKKVIIYGLSLSFKGVYSF